MKIICNVTGSERKRMAEVLGEYLRWEPVYKKAPTFAYVVNEYTIDKNGTIFCPISATVEDVAEIVAKLTDEGYTPEIEGIESVDEDDSSENIPVDEAPAEIPAETPDVAPEAEPEAQAEDEATEAAVGAETPDVAAPEEDAPTEADQPEDVPADEDASQPDENQTDEEVSELDNNKLTVSIPRAKLSNDALDRLRTIVSNKEELFKRALLAETLPIEVTEDKVSFPWFHLTGISGEAEAYSQFITALCQMAVEQKRVLDKPYDGDNDRFTMRIFMVRLNMKGPQFALARKLMMKHLTGNSGWRYEDSAAKSKNRNQPTWVGVRQLKNVYQNGIRVELIPMSDESVDDIHIGDYGTIVGVDEYGSVFVKLDNGSAFGLAFAIEQTEEEANTMLPIPFDLPEETASEVPSDAEAAEESEAPVPEDEPDAPDPEEDTLPNEDDSNEDED